MHEALTMYAAPSVGAWTEYVLPVKSRSQRAAVEVMKPLGGVTDACRSLAGSQARRHGFILVLTSPSCTDGDHDHQASGSTYFWVYVCCVKIALGNWEA